MKNSKARILLFMLMGLFLLMSSAPTVLGSENELSRVNIKAIETKLKKQMKSGKIPGLAVIIVNGSKVIRKNYGYANLQQKKAITRDTLFEIGSNSKAFTGLGILSLEKKGLIHLNDPVSKYLPWFKMRFQGKAVDITIGQCLYQTSGIPFKTIGAIPIDSGPGALEKTVKKLVNQELEFAPGEKFFYATINYDILGLVIQTVSGISYEDYIRVNILRPLQLNSTYLDRKQAYLRPEMAIGYKIGFLKPHEYYAPTYRGNTPAGYVITSPKDLERWLKIQMGALPVSPYYQELIGRSQLPDRTVEPSSGGSSYAAGWEIYQSGSGEISHAGGNPNFSSYIVFRPQDNIGVAVMANIASDYTNSIGQGIMNSIRGKNLKENDVSSASIDNVCFTLFAIAVIFSLVTIYFLMGLFKDVASRKRTCMGFKPRHGFAILAAMGFILAFGYCLYIAPKVLFDVTSWEFTRVWAPFSFFPSVMMLFITVVIFITYLILEFFFPKPDERPLFSLIMLSFVSGFGNAFIIFTINEALNRQNPITSGLLTFLFLGIILYVFGQKIIRTKMLKITNDLVYSKRMKLIEGILNSSFFRFEKLDNGKIQAGLNNDTETVSATPGVIINALTSIVTLICCFIYLGTINFYGLLLSILVIFAAAGLYYVVGKNADRLWEKTRDIQNLFFNFINDLILGFKELNLNKSKRQDFRDDMEKSCDEYRQKNTLASIKFVDSFVIGELLFTFVIAAVAFVFPVFFPEIETSTLRTYIFVFLYMTNPVHGVLDNIPQLFRIRISWNRINQLIAEISQPELAASKTESDETPVLRENERKLAADQEGVLLQLEGVEYEYHSNGEKFKVGPLDLKFKSGEITFITGGNGSGKTTLCKLITGLYQPDKGKIVLNGEIMSYAELGESYSNVFSDFHLFKKLYGIDWNGKNEAIHKYLNLLKIEHKLTVQEGQFSTLDLSNGQKKRLALMVSYLDDKPIFLFDEWAADQDPEFKKYFYTQLLQELKNRNKCVIAITHDDHYFFVADRIIKLDMGMLDSSIL